MASLTVFVPMAFLMPEMLWTLLDGQSAELAVGNDVLGKNV